MHNRVVRALFISGLIVLVLGIASLFVSVPVKEKHGIKAGPVSVGVETTDYQKVPSAVSIAFIAAGVVLMIAGGRKRG
jgi:sensor histidine kinase regulating citrate/malate metabolism